MDQAGLDRIPTRDTVYTMTATTQNLHLDPQIALYVLLPITFIMLLVGLGESAHMGWLMRQPPGRADCRDHRIPPCPALPSMRAHSPTLSHLLARHPSETIGAPCPPRAARPDARPAASRERATPERLRVRSEARGAHARVQRREVPQQEGGLLRCYSGRQPAAVRGTSCSAAQPARPGCDGGHDCYGKEASSHVCAPVHPHGVDQPLLLRICP